MASTIPVSARLPEYTVQQLKEMGEQTGMTKTQLLILAIDKLYSAITQEPEQEKPQ